MFLVLDHVFQEFVAFFKNSLSRKVCWADRMEFINGWYILLIISDFLTIIGSFIKIGIESKVSLGVCGRRVPMVGNLAAYCIGQDFLSTRYTTISYFHCFQ